MNVMQKWDRVAAGMAAIALAATILLYSRLPDPMPVHFDIRGVADGFMPRWLGASVMFLAGGLTYVLLRFGDRFLPESARRGLNTPAMRTVSAVVVILLAAIQGIILYAGVVQPPNVSRVTSFVLASFCLMLGLVLPKLRQNRFAGIRTPWTMRSEEVWSRTHRLGGHLLVAASVLGFIGTLVGSLALTITALLVACVIPVVYSYLVARDLGSRK